MGWITFHLVAYIVLSSGFDISVVSTLLPHSLLGLILFDLNLRNRHQDGLELCSSFGCSARSFNTLILLNHASAPFFKLTLTIDHQHPKATDQALPHPCISSRSFLDLLSHRIHYLSIGTAGQFAIAL